MIMLINVMVASTEAIASIIENKYDNKFFFNNVVVFRLMIKSDKSIANVFFV